MSNGVICEGEAYTLQEFMRRMAIKKDALRRWREMGLEPIQVGQRKYILGEDAIRFLRSLRED